MIHRARSGIGVPVACQTVLDLKITIQMITVRHIETERMKKTFKDGDYRHRL